MAWQTRSSVAGVILAAGRSERFEGGAKLVAELGGVALVRRVALATLGSRLRQVRVVLGHAASAVRRALRGLDVECVLSAGWAQGQSSSVRAGLEGLSCEVTGVLFVPGDQPLVTSRSINRLIEAFEVSGRRIVRPRAGGRPGAPVLWDASLFPRLRALEGDTGGRRLLPRYAAEVLEVEIEDPLELADVDTRAQLRALEDGLGPGA